MPNPTKLEPPPLLGGEDEAEYEVFVDQCISAIGPKDTIERIWLQDFIDNTWDIQRLRRIKVSIVQAARKAGVKALIGQFTGHGRHSAHTQTVADAWSEGNPDSRTYVTELLTANDLNDDAIIAEACRDQYKTLKRIDGLIAAYSYRRDAQIRELDRRRDGLAKRVREYAKAEAEEAVFEEVEPKPKQLRKHK
ncbi:MAG: hypothetical protein VW226_10965 [Rhodospirillaceae bacterium]